MGKSIEEWREEMRSAWLYAVLAEHEAKGRRREMFESLRSAALRQAGLWAERARASGATLPETFDPGPRARLAALLVRRLGVRRCLPALAALKVRGLSVYRSPHPSSGSGHVMPRSLEDFGDRHGTRGGGTLRAAVFGVNDGLVSNTSLILGIAGATPDPSTITVTGLAGLLAGAFSMAAGEYVSVRSQRELYEYQIGLERAELEHYPEEETEELALIYQARGLTLEAAREMARTVMADSESALEILAREELGLDANDLGSPWAAGLASFAAFATGACVPLLPFLWLAGDPAVVAAASLAALALFAVGAGLSLFTGRNAWWSGLRMLGIGGAAGLATWAIGSAFGVALG